MLTELLCECLEEKLDSLRTRWVVNYTNKQNHIGLFCIYEGDVKLESVTNRTRGCASCSLEV